MTLAIFGQKHWASCFQQVTESVAGDCVEAHVVNEQVLSPKLLLFLRKAQWFIRVGFRPGAPTFRGVAFDVVWEACRALNPTARAAHFWVGTDVVNTVRDVCDGRIQKWAFLRAKGDLHLTTAPWLIEELAKVGIKSHYVLFFDKLPEDILTMAIDDPLPYPFTVLSYIPDRRPDLYGSETIYECAHALPSVRFEVIGGHGVWVDRVLPNLRFFGWQNITGFLRRASVVIRIMRHDGMGGTVRQGLAAARHVVYSFPLPYTIHVRFGDASALINAIESLYAEARSKGLSPNRAGREYALQEFDVVPHYHRMLDILRSHSKA